MSEDEIRARLALLEGWSRGENWIEKEYRFKNFLRAISFVNAVAHIAEQSNHHPDITIHHNEVRLRNWTHAAGGLTEYDFKLADRIDTLLSADQSRRSGANDGTLIK